MSAVHTVLRSGLLLLGLVVTVSAVAEVDRSAQREQFRSARAAIARPPADGWKRLAIGLEDYPLFPYLELAALKRSGGVLQRGDVERFLQRWNGSLPARDLRETYLRQLADRGEWAAFRALAGDERDRDLRCATQRARLDAGERPTYADDLAPLWLHARAAPAVCEPLFAWARGAGVLTDAAVWERAERAADAGNADTVAAMARLLDGAAHADAERIAAAVRDPAATLAKAATWADTARTRDAASWGLVRLARRDSAAAETRWADLGARFAWDAPQKDRVLNALAVFRATSYSPDAMARLKALPASAEDDASREWRVRVALAGADWTETLAALDALSATQQADPRWRYLRARMLAKLDRRTESQAQFTELARESGYFGFLAADWVDAPYAICPRALPRDAGAESAVARQSDLARAFEFFALGQLPEARREWDFALAKLDAAQRLAAIERAYRAGWYDRAVFALSADPATQQVYEQRFPLAEKTRLLRGAAAAGIDPAWAYAIVRAESAWMTDARSHADAYGLMQLLPSVAKPLARSDKLAYSTPNDLFEPGLNLALGTRFLGQMAARFDGSPWLASAAYNAGATPVNRWLATRGTLEPDFFIETIPYRETREYVSRVLAFSVIYDWRLNGKAVPLAARMPKIGQTYRAPAADGPRKAVACPAAGEAASRP